MKDQTLGFSLSDLSEDDQKKLLNLIFVNAADNARHIRRDGLEAAGVWECIDGIEALVRDMRSIDLASGGIPDRFTAMFAAIMALADRGTAGVRAWVDEWRPRGRGSH